MNQPRHHTHIRKDGLPVVVVRIRARVHKGNLEPVESVNLPEGEEVMLTLDVPDDRKAKKVMEVPVFKDMRLLDPFPLTRRKIYEDI